MTTRPFPAYLSCAVESSGISARQGPHQRAQKFDDQRLAAQLLEGEGPVVGIVQRGGEQRCGRGLRPGRRGKQAEEQRKKAHQGRSPRRKTR